MITHLAELLLMVAGFWLALGALIAILARIESALDDAVAMGSEGRYLNVVTYHTDSVGLLEPRRYHTDRSLITEASESHVAADLPGWTVRDGDQRADLPGGNSASV